MATSVTPISAIPTTSGDISGQFTSTSTVARLSGALTSGGADTLVLIRQNGTGYWEAVDGGEIDLERSTSDFTGGSKSVDVQIGNSGDKLHVVSKSGRAISNGAVTLESLTGANGVSLPAISGDTLATLNAAQSLASKTLVTPLISTGLTATGSASNDFSGSTGAFKTSTGAVTIGGGASAIGLTSSGAAITVTAGAASVWSTSAGALAIAGAAGINLRYGATVVADVGVTNSAKVTLAANKSIAGAAGTGAVEFGSMTGDCALPTGALSWAGASAKALSLVATGAGITVTGGAASAITTGSGALTITSAAAATWSTAAGALTVSGAGGVNLQYNGGTLADVGVTSSTKVTLAANIDLAGAAGTGALALGSMTGATALPTGNLSWAGASTKTVSIVSTGSGSSVTITAGAASTWKTSSGALTVDSAAALNLGTSDSTSQALGKSGTILTLHSKLARSAAGSLIADPGTGAAIPVTADGVCAMTSAGAETRTLAIPTYIGQRLSLICDVYVGNIVVTSAQAINQAGNTVMTFGAAADAIVLEAMQLGGALRWRVVGNDGVALS